MTTPREDKACELLNRFLVAVRYWGAQEDGIPEEMAGLYCEAKGLLNHEYANDSNMLEAAQDYKGVTRF